MPERDFQYFKEHYDESMGDMFAAVSDLYVAYWGDLFHFVLFETDDESWAAAFERTHRRYMDELDVVRAGKVLVLACGRGGFAHVIAQNTEAEVLDIDISKAQLAKARRRSRANLRFEHLDVMRVDELEATFDAAVCLDATCYLPDKALAVEKIASVLRPGARLLIVDWCKQEGLSALQEELVLQPFMKYWAIPGLETMRTYRRHFERSGLRVVRLTDLSDKDKVYRNWEFGYQRALRAVRSFP